MKPLNINIFERDPIIDTYYLQHPNSPPVPVDTVTATVVSRSCGELDESCRYVAVT